MSEASGILRAVSEKGMRYVVEGRVQGVWFRAFTQEAAQDLGLRGWVRNRFDGSVELEAAGPPERLAELERRLRQGPPAAEVSRLEKEPLEELPREASFEIRYS